MEGGTGQAGSSRVRPPLGNPRSQAQRSARRAVRSAAGRTPAGRTRALRDRCERLGWTTGRARQMAGPSHCLSGSAREGPEGHSKHSHGRPGRSPLPEGAGGKTVGVTPPRRRRRPHRREDDCPGFPQTLRGEQVPRGPGQEASSPRRARPAHDWARGGDGPCPPAGRSVRAARAHSPSTAESPRDGGTSLPRRGRGRGRGAACFVLGESPAHGILGPQDRKTPGSRHHGASGSANPLPPPLADTSQLLPRASDRVA